MPKLKDSGGALNSSQCHMVADKEAAKFATLANELRLEN